MFSLGRTAFWAMLTKLAVVAVEIFFRMGRFGSSLKVALAVVVACVGHTVMAQSPEQIAEKIPGVVLLSSVQEHVRDQLVPLGTVKEGRDGRAQPESSKRFAGELKRNLYQLPSEMGLSSFKSVLESAWFELHPDSQRVYQCSGRECGQSNLWANDVFGESMLFGNDRTQFAVVYLAANGLQLNVVYGSERPNKRSHFTVMSLGLADPWQPAATAPQIAIANRWQVSISRTARGLVDVKRLPVLLDPVTRQLAKSPIRHWAVIAHECEKQPAPAAFEHSQQILDGVLPFLQKIPDKQFHQVNAGNALSAPCGSGKNLEIIELQP